MTNVTNCSEPYTSESGFIVLSPPINPFVESYSPKTKLYDENYYVSQVSPLKEYSSYIKYPYTKETIELLLSFHTGMFNFINDNPNTKNYLSSFILELSLVNDLERVYQFLRYNENYVLTDTDKLTIDNFIKTVSKMSNDAVSLGFKTPLPVPNPPIPPEKPKPQISQSGLSKKEGSFLIHFLVASFVIAATIGLVAMLHGG